MKRPRALASVSRAALERDVRHERRVSRALSVVSMAMGASLSVDELVDLADRMAEGNEATIAGWKPGDLALDGGGERGIEFELVVNAREFGARLEGFAEAIDDFALDVLFLHVIAFFYFFDNGRES